MRRNQRKSLHVCHVLLTPLARTQTLTKALLANTDLPSTVYTAFIPLAAGAPPAQPQSTNHRPLGVLPDDPWPLGGLAVLQPLTDCWAFIMSQWAGVMNNDELYNSLVRKLCTRRWARTHAHFSNTPPLVTIVTVFFSFTREHPTTALRSERGGGGLPPRFN